MNKVAIMLPVYNAENTLQRCIDSLKNQTYQDYVVMARDDGSTDSSLKILKSNESDKIKVFSNIKNLGCVLNRNKILEDSLAIKDVAYIAIQDADDWSEPNRIEKQVEFLEKNKEYGVCGTWYYWHDVKDRGQSIKAIKTLTEDVEIRRMQYFGSQACHGSYVIRREVYNDVGFYDPYFVWSHDNDWLTRLLYGKKWKVCTIPENLYHVWVTEYTHSKTNERNIYKQKQRYKRYCESVGVKYEEKYWRRI